MKRTPHPTTQLSVQPVSPHPISELSSMRPHREKRDSRIVWGLGLSAPLWRLTKSGTEVGLGGVCWGQRSLLPCLQQPIFFFFFSSNHSSIHKGRVRDGEKKNCKHLRDSHADGWLFALNISDKTPCYISNNKKKELYSWPQRHFQKHHLFTDLLTT